MKQNAFGCVQSLQGLVINIIIINIGCVQSLQGLVINIIIINIGCVQSLQGLIIKAILFILYYKSQGTRLQVAQCGHDGGQPLIPKVIARQVERAQREPAGDCLGVWRF